MELTRRDALAALAATGIAGGAAVYLTDDDDESPASGGQSGEDSPGTVETATALAPVVFPSEVDDSQEFVRTYVTGRLENDETYRSGMADAAEALDGHAREEYDAAFRDLSTAQRDELLVSIGVDRVQPDPDGSDLSKIRFYLVNELLYGLFSSPTGGELVGTANPPGHPGGLDTYQGGGQR
jgi:hypothetical protein